MCISVLPFTVQATQGLVLPVERTTGLGCIPEGRTVSYECTVTDPLDPPVGPVTSTIWQGTAFICPTGDTATNNRISLPHSQSMFGAGGCGGLSAVSTGFSGNDYTSTLTLTATTELNGLTVVCMLGENFVVGNDTIKIGGKYVRTIALQ